MRSASALTCLTAYALLAGCVSYQTKPVDLSRTMAERGERRLPPAAAPWSTAALLAQAIAWAPSIRESAANYRSLAAAAKSARVPLPAQLQLAAEYSHDDNPNKPWLGSGSLNLPLDFGGRRNSRVDTADLAVLQARYDYGEAVWTTRSAIARARIDRLFADRIAPLATRVLALRQDRYDKLRNRVESGEEARPISIAAQTDLAIADRRVRDIAARATQADIALATAMGLDRAAVAELRLEAMQPAVPSPAASDLASLRQQAGAGRRDLLRAIVDYDLAENAVRLEVASQYPALSIQPGYTYERGLVKLPFGLNLALPPFDLNRAAIAAAEAKRAQAGRKLETIQAGILGDVDRTATALKAQDAARSVTETRDLPAAQRLARTATAGVRAGETDRVDEDAAIAASLEAEIALLEATRLEWLALVDLEDALRHPSDVRDGQVLEAAMARLGDTK